jgi:hypothetical protein
VAKIVDFLDRGAAGVISVAGLNCAVGTITASIIPAIRADYGYAPVMSLTCGNGESPIQRVCLETFVQQVHRRSHSSAA